MKTQKCYDAAGIEFEGYQIQLSDGSYLQVDRKIAEAFGDPEGFVANEVKQAEESIRAN